MARTMTWIRLQFVHHTQSSGLIQPAAPSTRLAFDRPLWLPLWQKMDMDIRGNLMVLCRFESHNR